MVLASSQVRMLSGAEVSVSLALRRRHMDLLEVFSETNALLYALLPEALSVASSYSKHSASFRSGQDHRQPNQPTFSALHNPRRRKAFQICPHFIAHAAEQLQALRFGALERGRIFETMMKVDGVPRKNRTGLSRVIADG
jgi:hypothetical protein